MKRPCERRAIQSPHSQLVFFVDRSCGRKKIPNALRKMGLVVEIHDDHFPQDAEDTEVLALCGRNRWIYVAQDLEVRRNPAELTALEGARIHAIFPHGRNQPAEYAIANFKSARKRLLKMLQEQTAPLHVAVLAGSRVTVLNEPYARR